MDFAYSAKVEGLRTQVQAFMDAQIVPRIKAWQKEVEMGQFPVSFMEELKSLARQQGLWNLFLPALKTEEPGTPLTNLEYAPLAEIMGRVSWASEVFNCNAPDTGNMELLHMFSSPAQYDQWLAPLLNGEIRSAFAMTEPKTASSDASNIQTRITREGDHYIISGRKWWITNAAHPDCRLLIVMGKTNPEADTYHQQSMILVPIESAGVTVIRNLTVMNHHHPEGHCEIDFDQLLNLRNSINLSKNSQKVSKPVLAKEGLNFPVARNTALQSRGPYYEILRYFSLMKQPPHLTAQPRKKSRITSQKFLGARPR